MYKNLSETAAHKKSLWSKLIVPKKTFFPCRLLCLIAGNSFFREQYFFISRKSLRPAILQRIRYSAEGHLHPWITYIQCIWKLFLFKVYYCFKRVLAVMHLSGTVIISGDHLQWSSILKGTVFLWNKQWQSSLFSKVLS